MRNLLIPASGDGIRFKSFGYFSPKPAIKVVKKPIIYWSLLGASRSIDFNRILISTRTDHEPEISEAIKFSVNNLNTPSPEVLQLNSKTRGPAETIYKIIKNAQNLGKPIEGEIYCLDSDVYLSYSQKNVTWEDSEECFVVTSISTHPQHSYVKYIGKRVIDIKEKVKISERAVAGCYIFKSAETYLNLYQKAEEKLSQSSEIYLSDVVKISVDNGTCYKIDSDSHISIGTPKELKNSKKYLKKLDHEFKKIQGGSGATIIEKLDANLGVKAVFKSSYGKSAENLKHQMDFMSENQDTFKFPKIYSFTSSNKYFSYSM